MAQACVAMQTADAITNLDNRRGTLTAGGGGLSESYESYESYERYESGGAPLNYATVVSLQKPCSPSGYLIGASLS